MGSKADGLGAATADIGAVELTGGDHAHIAQHRTFLDPLNWVGDI